ncbi:hypothetical protein LNV08_04595 [Paucibacter sp. TC2R-5]|uniref:hypothetical protein n=1 Tax=Paucibacter sp. TC2R-5 TaxID=2893555 RepID=UPI0021E4345A|nr:hypothetical protein [Paucibacter sp. TC2R-5]MCV2358247.1 hypothetical protein [Paucibacter sp. TC2R-5]
MSKISVNSNFKILLLLASLSFIGAQAQSAEPEITVSAELQAQLKAHASNDIPMRPLAGYTVVEEIDHKTNLSKIYVDSVAQLLLLENGLTGASSKTIYRSGAAQGVGRGMSVCGLITVLSESQSSTDTSSTSILPIGKLFIPFGIKSSVDFANRYRLTKLESSYPSLCNPSVGQEFNYKFLYELTMKTSGIFGGTKVFERSSYAKCKVGNESVPANKLHESLQGEALLVACEAEDQDGKKNSADYFFLKDSAYYLMTSRVDDWQRSKLSYTAIPYAAK